MWRTENLFSLPGMDPRVVQRVASCYIVTDYGILAFLHLSYNIVRVFSVYEIGNLYVPYFSNSSSTDCRFIILLTGVTVTDVSGHIVHWTGGWVDVEG